MKILLVGEYYSENLGDPLLCQTVEKTIAAAYPEAEIIPLDMTGKISSTECYPLTEDPTADGIWKFFFEHFRERQFTTICRIIEDSKPRHLRVWYMLDELLQKHRFDLVVFAGGSIFMNYFAGIIYLIVKRFSLSRTKIIFHACGMSQLDGPTEYVLRQALRSRNIVSISLRDSYERFTSLFSVRAAVSETSDTALNSSLYFSPAEEPVAELGIGLIDRCYDEQMALIQECMHSERNWKAFTNGSPYDQEYAAKLLTDAGIPANNLPEYLMERPVTTQELIRTVTGFQKIIAFRMHCQIAAASFGIPSFGLVWDGKIVEFYKKLGFPQGCAQGTPDFGNILNCLEQYDAAVQESALQQGRASRESLLRAITKATKQKPREGGFT